MWKLVDGRLVHTTDDSRVELEARVSQAALEAFDIVAEETNSVRNYVIENALKNLMSHGVINFDKKNRPDDRVRYRTTYDKDVVESLRELAKEKKLFPGDIIEYSYDYIDKNEVLHKNYRYRIEVGR